MRTSLDRILAALALVGLMHLAGCAGEPFQRQGVDMKNEKTLEKDLERLEQASRNEPTNLPFRLDYLNARAQVIDRLLTRAQQERAAGAIDEAESLLRRVLALDRSNSQATAVLLSLTQERQHTKYLAEAAALMATNDLPAAEQKLSLILQDNPRHADARAMRHQLDEVAGRNQVISPTLRASFQKPITIEFRDAGLKQFLEALSRHSGLNFVLDKDVPANVSVTVFLTQVSVDAALDVVLTTNQLSRRMLNDTTVLIYPDTPAKQNEHQQLIVKSYFLANADAKQVMTMLRTVLKVKNVFVDDKLNLLIMRDTWPMIRLADRLVATHDVSEPEVMLELEVIEVSRSRLLNLGIQLPSQLVLSPLPSTGTVLTLRDLQNQNALRTGAAISSTIINLESTDGSTNLLANPRIRTHNREKALVRIGDRVPVITTTATSTGFVSESVQYVDVGLKLEVEPTIYPNDEVSIKVSLEVSSVVREIISTAGTVSYQIGSRNASTVLRLKDGETQILAGLINDDDRKAANRFPGLGHLPIIGRLFSSHRDDHRKTELMLSITPRLIRSLNPPALVPGEFWSGTENSPRLNTTMNDSQRPAPTPPSLSPSIPPAVSAPPATTEASPSAPVPLLPPSLPPASLPPSLQPLTPQSPSP